jgi:mannosyl-oligosaccharide alpha-1,2-mannosidase
VDGQLILPQLLTSRRWRTVFLVLEDSLHIHVFLNHEHIHFLSMVTIRRSLRYFVIAAVILVVLYVRKHRGDYGFPLHRTTRRLSMVKSSIDWASFPPFYPPSSIASLPTGKPRPLPRIQHKFPHQSRADFAQQEPRRQAIKSAFQRCWRSYKQYAWMRDELTPISGGAKDTFGGWAATLIDSLDTLWIMDLEDEYYEAVEAVIALDWANTTESSVNIFETTIRHLGGLLSAYDLSRDQALLDKAVELGDMLYAGFDTPNRMPGFWLDFEKARSGNLIADDHEPSASPCSLSLEFTRLSQLTGEPKYYDAVARITTLLDESQNSTKLPGMWPTFFDMRQLVLDQDNTFTLGALSDSLYEYLPKMYALLGGLDPVYERLFRGSAETIKRHLLFRPMLPDNPDILFSGTATVNEDVVLNPEGQHLSCFVGGMFAHGGRLFDNQEYIDIGAKVTRGCIYAYNAFPTGLMPEIFNMIACDSLDGCAWNEELWTRERQQERLPPGFITARVPYYMLRPEAIESVFLLYRITGLKEFQDAAWQMFESIQRVTETEFGNAGIEDVTVSGEPTKRDSMEVSLLSLT